MAGKRSRVVDHDGQTVELARQKLGEIWVQHPQTCSCCQGTYVRVEVVEGTEGVLVRRDIKQVWSHIKLVQGNLAMVQEAGRDGLIVYLSPHHTPRVQRRSLQSCAVHTPPGGEA